jgi:uncharacterized MAPEG superfamily protein
MASAILPGLSVEMAYLALSVLLLLVHVGAQSMLLKAQSSNAYTAGARDEALPATGRAGRAERALRNFLETFPAFAALALALEVLGRADAWTAFGAALYFWSRLAYLPLYLAGTPWIRSLVWCAASSGIAIMLWRFVF